MQTSLLQAKADGVYLSIKVQPRASKNEIVGVVGEELKVRVNAPPVDSAANEAVVELLAERLEVGKSAVSIVRGRTSRHKMVRIIGLNAKIVSERLELTKICGPA